MKFKLSVVKLLTVSMAFILFYSGQSVAIDRCSPELLDKLPASKRAMLEKTCKNKENKSDFTISNLKNVDSEKRPTDSYDGSDKDELVAMVKEAWAAKYPNDQIMGVHISDKKWKTTKTKKWNNAVKEFQYNDKSVLTAKVVVKTDDKLATIFPAFINRNNDDDTSNVGVSTKNNKFVIRQMLVANY